MKLFDTDRVLVPVDFSEESFLAQQLTLEFLEDASRTAQDAEMNSAPVSSKLYVLHVLPHLSPGDPGVIWNTMDDNTRIAHVRKAFQERSNLPKDRGIHFSVAIGEPGTEIIKYAEAEKINLIVIPSHGRTGLSHFFLGSVAEKVIRYAHCPVLVLRRDMLRKGD